MRICGTGNFPINAAKAYGIKPGTSVTRASASTLSASAKPQQPDAFEPSEAVKKLVAGKVSQPVNFDGPALQSARAAQVNGAFQLYTRAADKMEAAMAVQIGRSIDVQG